MADDRMELARLRDCLRNCADELESEINARYGIPVHPAQKSRYERDLSTVVEARALLSAPATPSEGLVERAQHVIAAWDAGRIKAVDEGEDKPEGDLALGALADALSTPATPLPVPEEVMEWATEHVRRAERDGLDDRLLSVKSARFIVSLGKEGANNG